MTDAIDPDVIRTLIGEQGTNVDGLRSVASVIVNIAKARGESVSQVVKDPGTFLFGSADKSIWPKIKDIPTTDPRYQAAVNAASGILSGQEAPVGPWTQYYSPRAQTALHQQNPSLYPAVPKWDDGTGVHRGASDSLFFTHPVGAAGQAAAPSMQDKIQDAVNQGYSATDIYSYLRKDKDVGPKIQEAEKSGYPLADIYKQIGLTPPPNTPNAGIVAPDPEVGGYVYADKIGGPITQAQYQTVQALKAAGKFNDEDILSGKATPGSQAAPRVARADTRVVDPKDWWIDTDGTLHGPQGTDPGIIANLVAGTKQADRTLSGPIEGAIASGEKALGINDPTEARINAAIPAANTAYAANPQSYTAASHIGDFAEQTAFTAPALAAGGEVEAAAAAGAKAIPVVGPAITKALQFAAGRAESFLPEATSVAGDVKNALLKFGSRTAAGAQLGAGQNALTGQDPTMGAIAGAVIPPVLDTTTGAGTAAVNAAKGLVRPLTEGGQEKIAANLLKTFAQGGPTDINAESLIPGVKPTLSQATGNTGIAAVESGIRNQPNTTAAKLLAQRDAENAAARVAAYGEQAGTPESMEALIAQRGQVTDQLRENALAPSIGGAATNGNNLITAYHGTPANFAGDIQVGMPSPHAAYENEFGKGIYFTNDAEYAGQFAGDQGSVHKVNLDMKNPLVYNVKDLQLGGETPNMEDAVAKGHDGLIIKSDQPNIPTEYVVPSADQIKSPLEQPHPSLDAARAMLGPNATDEELQWASKLMPPSGQMPAPPKFTGPSDPKPVIAAIDSILAGPAGQRDAVASALKSVRDKLVGPDGTLQTDPAQLYGIRQHLTDLLSPLSSGSATSARLAGAQLKQVEGVLDDAIEQGAPGYKKYLDTYHSMSLPIDQQRFLQGLNLTDGQGRITLAKVDSALKGAEKLRGAPGTNNAKSLTDDQMHFLYNLREDLRREVAPTTALNGRVGSSSIQNAGTQFMMKNLGVAAPLVSLVHRIPVVGPLAHGLIGSSYDKSNEAILNKLVTMILEPHSSSTQAALAPQEKSAVAQFLKRGLSSGSTYVGLPATVNRLTTVPPPTNQGTQNPVQEPGPTYAQ